MKIYTNNKFTGHYPVGTAAVILAKNVEDAASSSSSSESTFYLALELKKHGLKTESSKPEDFKEMPLKIGQVSVLCDGDY